MVEFNGHNIICLRYMCTRYFTELADCIGWIGSLESMRALIVMNCRGLAKSNWVALLEAFSAGDGELTYFHRHHLFSPQKHLELTVG